MDGIFSFLGPPGTQHGKIVFTSGKEEKKKGKGSGMAGVISGTDGKATVKPGGTAGGTATVKQISTMSEQEEEW